MAVRNATAILCPLAFGSQGASLEADFRNPPAPARPYVWWQWFNRLAGDERYPADFEWGRDRGPAMGRAIKAYPSWFLKGEPMPSRDRQGFVICYYHRNDTPPIPAGLPGPVTLQPVAVQEVKP